MNTKAKFISIEGIEGTGKSTAVKAICDFLEKRNIEYVLTREPGGTPVAEEIRKVLLSNREETMCPDTEVLLMFAGRAQNIAEVIKPALAAGKWVVSDRFVDASFAYQGGGRNIDTDHIQALSDWVLGDLKPDCTILLDAPVEVGLSRMSSRGAKDRIEQEGTAFFERARQAYLDCAKREFDRFHIVDAAKEIMEVAAEIAEVLEAL